jgi:SAM-dependent methyltransferase
VDPAEIPLPPYELATRVGCLDDAPDPWATYEWIGRASRDDLLAALPDEFSLEGRRILDFGCGAGRTLRHLIADGPAAELWGCDIDIPSIEWMQRSLSPAVNAFVNGEAPPLDQPDETFDLIYCVSVFTHLTRYWSGWLLELHRLLKPDGLLVASFMGEGQSEVVAGEEWDEERVGMLVLRPGQAWDAGGPMVLHSPWWIREHWGRLFDILALTPHGFPGVPAGQGHGLATMRKRDVRQSETELEAPSRDPREVTALAHNADHLMRELEELRPAFDAASAAAALGSD